MKKFIAIALIAVAVSAYKQAQNESSYFKVNDTTSKIEWKGSTPDHFHVGSFDVTGTVTATPDGQVKSGDFVIPVSSIVDYDLPDPVRQTLLEDLKSANFFNMAVHPQTKFHITKSVPYSGTDTSAVKGANYLLTGDFTMLGQTRSITFPAKISLTGDSLKTEAKFKIDRTQWGMKIYSDPKQKLFIYPDVNINLRVLASRTK